MPNSTPHYIIDTTLSRAWAHGLLALLRPGEDYISPLTISVTGLAGRDLDAYEEPAIQQALEHTLAALNKPTTRTVANTLFPQSLWNPAAEREMLFRRYTAIAPHLKKACPANRYGLYFDRLIAYGHDEVNQLDRIIQLYRCGTHRHSALQAAILDPAKDITSQPMRGFPCLQQVAFKVLHDRHLIITGFYATQYFVERAYGNYVGLCRLGRFMAHEMGLELVQMNCIASVAQLGDDVSKGDLTGLQHQLSSILSAQQMLF